MLVEYLTLALLVGLAIFFLQLITAGWTEINVDTRELDYVDENHIEVNYPKGLPQSDVFVQPWLMGQLFSFRISSQDSRGGNGDD